MLKIENTQVVGLEPAIRGMRNPMNSWEKSDSGFWDVDGYYDILGEHAGEGDSAADHFLGPNDKDLMKRLASAGKDHAKFRRMIVVYADMIAPLYWWKEYDTYKVGTVANSCSTMHKIHAKEFSFDDFSCDHLTAMQDCEKACIGLQIDDKEYEKNLLWVHPNPYSLLKDQREQMTPISPEDILRLTIHMLNSLRREYLETGDKEYWYQMIQLLPSSYNQRRTVMLNYEVLANIYPARKAHKLDDWHTFCDWIRNLPESWIITGEEKDA